MNYPYFIPGTQTSTASFVANSTLILGTLDKPLDAKTLVTVDYSAVVPAIVLASYSLRVKPGGEPQLRITGTALSSPATKLSFYVQGGIAGRAYEVTINAKLADGEIRSDVLTVQMLGDDCGCVVIPLPPLNGVVSGDGSIIVNTAPRFFVSATIPVGANVLDRWYDTTTGDVYDYISNGITSLWQLGGSGGGGGGGGGSNVTIIGITPITPDGITTIFNLTSITARPVTITGSNTLFVSVDGVWQDAATQYAAVNNQISFAQAPNADSVIFMLWFAPFTTS